MLRLGHPALKGHAQPPVSCIPLAGLSRALLQVGRHLVQHAPGGVVGVRLEQSAPVRQPRRLEAC